MYSAVDTENFVDCAACLVLDKGLLALFELMVLGGRWNPDPACVFIHELGTLTMAAHCTPELVGQDHTGRVDPDGVLPPGDPPRGPALWRRLCLLHQH